MDKARTVAEALSKETGISLSLNEERAEGYEATYYGGKMDVTANSYPSAIHAIDTLHRMQRRGHLPEFLGKKQPKFPFRGILLDNQSVPDDTLTSLLIKCGWNAIFTDDHKEMTHFGLSTITKDSQFLSDYLYHESQPTHLTLDAITQEIKAIEEQYSQKQKLIFALPDTLATPKRQSEWLGPLCDEVGQNTIIAFHADNGIHLHPFWEVLRQTRYPSATPLLPIVSSNTPHFELIRMQMTRHPFLGLLLKLDSPPSLETLWSLGQSLWYHQPLPLFNHSFTKNS